MYKVQYSITPRGIDGSYIAIELGANFTTTGKSRRDCDEQAYRRAEQIRAAHGWAERDAFLWTRCVVDRPAPRE